MRDNGAEILAMLQAAPVQPCSFSAAVSLKPDGYVLWLRRSYQHAERPFPVEAIQHAVWHNSGWISSGRWGVYGGCQGMCQISIC
ncbi:hypothetical protein N7468_006639 [Penicillium chermesinum]|uniref:Uncharacterized protein n=1 Tax=Penicillium chermesinum TaxID=63820 RepID=A0A9W9NVE7_9EURO|nr:uncharacterized protein N7468_006639 [Penicillium chermesinum]KAJ5225414.1 hypothetical protein N7468_006639 [Penicillium chermesinum]KAJ6161362.1 hypothetical protein N7470_004758 [Penicillium chermesinum]